MGILNFLTSKMLGESEPERKYGFSYGFDMHGVDLNEGIEKRDSRAFDEGKKTR